MPVTGWEPNTVSESSFSATRLVRNPDLRLVMVAGPDATVFLNAQAMTPLTDSGENECLICAFADNRGRVIATATAWHQGEAWQLLVPAGQADWLVSHLLRYRFRSRCDIEVLVDYGIVIAIGPGAGDLLRRAGLSVPETGHAQGDEQLGAVALSGDRYIVTGDKDDIDSVSATLEAECEATGNAYWRGVCMRAGEVTVYEATRGHFLPQMLNLDEAEVIGWHKGCYPGQEVIARLQHRGQVKKRLLLIDRPLEVGIGERTDVEDIPVEVVDHGVLEDSRAVTQVVAPHPFDPVLEKLKL